MMETGLLGGDMASVAARIQERASILIIERKKLNDTRDQLLELEQERDREQQINDLRRRHLLEITNARNEVELDIFKAKDQIQDLERSIVECEDESRLLQERYKQATEEYNHKLETMYGPQMLEMELYEQALKETVQAGEKKLQGRLDRLTSICAECTSIEAEEEAFRKEARRFQEEANKLRSQATPSSGKDEAIANLSKRIREAICEVSVR
jgi:chromosome segregation ATPase